MLWMAYGEQGECRHRRKNSCVACNKVKRLHEDLINLRNLIFTTNKDVQRWILSERAKNKRLI